VGWAYLFEKATQIFCHKCKINALLKSNPIINVLPQHCN